MGGLVLHRCVCLILSALLTASCLPSCNTGGTKSPKLEVSEIQYDFGSVKQGERVEHSFVLRNRGNAMLHLRVEIPPGLFLQVKADEEIPPGGAGKVVMSLETWKYAKEIRAQANIFSNDPNLPGFKLALTGRVIAPVAFLPFKAVFLAAFRGETAARELTIVNNSEKPLEVFGIEYRSDRFQAQLQKVKEGQEYKLLVQNNPNASPGKTCEDLLLFTSHSELAEIKLPVNIYIKQDVYFFPDQINLGKIYLKEFREKVKKSPELIQSLTQTVLVKRRLGKGKDFQVNLESDLPFLTITKTPESQSETYRLEVTPVPGKLIPGKVDSFIRVHSNDPEVPEVRIPVRGEII